VNGAYGHWTIVSTDSRAAVCRCRCGAVRALSLEAIKLGVAAPSCGCAPLAQAQLTAFREERAAHERRRELGLRK